METTGIPQETTDNVIERDGVETPVQRIAAHFRGGFGAGVGAALVMLLVMAVLRLTTNTISIPELLEDSLTRLAGGQLESFFINNLGVGGKALLLVSIVEGTLLLGGLLGLAFTYSWSFLRSLNASRWLYGVGYGILVGLFLNVVVLPIVGQGFFGSDTPIATAPEGISKALWGSAIAPIGLPVAISMFVISIVFGLTLVKLLRWPETAVIDGKVMQQVGSVPTAPDHQRRALMKALGGGGLAIFGGAALWGVITKLLEAPKSAALVEADPGASGPPAGGTAVANVPGQPTAVAGAEFDGVKALLVPDVTPVDSFYITTKNLVDPTLDGDSWALEFKGLVDSPYTINLKDLKAMPSMDRIETLACISNSVGGDLIGNGKWKGVDFAAMVKKANPKNTATEVIVHGADGYADSFPLKAALENGCVLVYEMNGAPLTTKHGFPARLLVPGIYGMKNCKWITAVELADYDFKGYWESRGWSDTAAYQTMSRIDFPNADNIPQKPVYISGVAFAGNRRIQKVEVSTDSGKTWAEARLRTPMSEFSWTQWTFPWNPNAGTHDLKVRATDGTGAVQTSNDVDTFPDGATGYHTKRVRIG